MLGDAVVTPQSVVQQVLSTLMPFDFELRVRGYPITARGNALAGETSMTLLNALQCLWTMFIASSSCLMMFKVMPSDCELSIREGNALAGNRPSNAVRYTLAWAFDAARGMGVF